MAFRRKRKKFSVVTLEKLPFVDFKDSKLLEQFLTDRGKIIPRRITGASAKYQRKLTSAIKRARMMALLPFVRE